MKITLHEEPATAVPWEIRQNDTRLCVRGTEHLFSVVKVERVGRSLIVSTIAENCTESDARLMAKAPELRAALEALTAWAERVAEEVTMGADDHAVIKNARNAQGVI